MKSILTTVSWEQECNPEQEEAQMVVQPQAGALQVAGIEEMMKRKLKLMESDEFYYLFYELFGC